MSEIELMIAARDFLPLSEVECNGLKCRGGNCSSCFTEESVREYISESRDVAAKLDAYIASGGWTRVEDGLPEDETPVFIARLGVLRIAELRWERPGYEDSWLAFRYWDDPENDGQEWEWDEITHWRELPTLPDEETK